MFKSTNLLSETEEWKESKMYVLWVTNFLNMFISLKKIFEEQM